MKSYDYKIEWDSHGHPYEKCAHCDAVLPDRDNYVYEPDTGHAYFRCRHRKLEGDDFTTKLLVFNEDQDDEIALCEECAADYGERVA